MNIRFGAQIAAAAASHHLDPLLLAAVAAQETGGPGSNSGANVVGDGGHGHGVFQIDDRSWAFARTPAAMDPAANADAAAGILAADLARYGGVRAALSAYNGGSPTARGTQTTWPDGERLGYADSVMRHYEALGGTPEQLAADGRTIAADVNALAGRAAGAPSDPAAAPAMPSAAFLPASLAAASPPPALTAAVSWASLNAAGAKDGSDADAALADLLDAGDVFTDASAADA